MLAFPSVYLVHVRLRRAQPAIHLRAEARQPVGEVGLQRARRLVPAATFLHADITMQRVIISGPAIRDLWVAYPASRASAG